MISVPSICVMNHTPLSQSVAVVAARAAFWNNSVQRANFGGAPPLRQRFIFVKSVSDNPIKINKAIWHLYRSF